MYIYIYMWRGRERVCIYTYIYTYIYIYICLFDNCEELLQHFLTAVVLQKSESDKTAGKTAVTKRCVLTPEENNDKQR